MHGSTRLRVLAATAGTFAVLSVLAVPASAFGTAVQTATALPTTGFEDRDGDGWTTLEEEYAFLDEVDAESDRMRYTEIGRTVEGRPMHLVRVGFPEPPSDDEIASGRSVLVLGSQHGNEPAGREMALQTLRDLAFTEDAVLVDQLRETAVLFVPTANPDGRVANTRENAQDIDVNRDHLTFETPEARTIARVLRDFTPEITVDAHERPSDTDPDMELLWARNPNVYQPLAGLTEQMVLDDVLPGVEAAGFSAGLYSSSTEEQERIFRNMTGLRHGVGMLAESAGQDPPLVRVDAHLAAVQEVLEFQRERTDDVVEQVTAAPIRKEEVGADRSEPFHLVADPAPGDEVVLDPPPCGYLLNDRQAQRIERHVELFSLRTERVGRHAVHVTMGQPMMTVVPFLMDRRAVYDVVAGNPLDDEAECADPGSVDPPSSPSP